MKYTITHTFTFICLLLAAITHAQAPQGIPYQAAARNSSGAVLASTAISVRFTIRDSIATGAIKYRETHSVTTTAQGMFSLNVGQGTVVSGTFAGINWSTNAKFMQVELAPAGGSSYIDMGTSQMMSVPYALYAGSANSISNTGGALSFTGLTITTSTPYVQGAGRFTVGGNVIADGGLLVNTKGVCWSTSPNPTVASTTKTINGLGGGFFTDTSSNFVGDVTYYIRAYVSNDSGTFYGNEIVYRVPLRPGVKYLGGIIGYILQSDDPGYISGETHGLIAAPSDQSTGIQWGCNSTTTMVGGTSTALGTGAANTTIVSAACGTGTAARLCSDLVLGGYSDWYLPSRDELYELYINRSSIGGFTTGYYWSSSEGYTYLAWQVGFGSGGIFNDGKIFIYYVRAVRAF
jgi:hypothetical protein